MKRKRILKIGAMAFVCVLLVAVISIYSIPILRTTLFVHTYHELIEESLSAGNGVPADDAVFFGYNAVNSWDKTHPMTEFIIMTYGDTYYGCYYSCTYRPCFLHRFGNAQQSYQVIYLGA